MKSSLMSMCGSKGAGRSEAEESFREWQQETRENRRRASGKYCRKPTRTTGEVHGNTVGNAREQEESFREIQHETHENRRRASRKYSRKHTRTGGKEKSNRRRRYSACEHIQITDEIKVHLTKLTCGNQNATEDISLKTNKTSSTVRGSSSRVFP